MCHEEVTVFDAVTVVLLLDTSMDSTSDFKAPTNPLHSMFPDDATQDYLQNAQKVLTG